MKSKDFSQQFERETKQRNQHHKKIVLKHEESIAITKLQHEIFNASS
jgi:hypothetical protein